MKSKKSIHSRWTDPIGTTESWSQSSKEEKQKLINEEYNQIKTFMKNGNKRKD